MGKILSRGGGGSGEVEMVELRICTTHALASVADFPTNLSAGYQPIHSLERSLKPHFPPKLFEPHINRLRTKHTPALTITQIPTKLPAARAIRLAMLMVTISTSPVYS